MMAIDMWRTAIALGFLASVVLVEGGGTLAPEDISCFECDSMEEPHAVSGDGQASCHDILGGGSAAAAGNGNGNGIGNVSSVPDRYRRACNPFQLLCGVRRYSYTRIERNGSQYMHFWGLRRYCARTCEPGCVVMGQRTKIHVCTECCGESFCNVGNSATSQHRRHLPGLDLRFPLPLPLLMGLLAAGLLAATSRPCTPMMMMMSAG